MAHARSLEDVTSPDKVLQCVVVTPEETVLQAAAQFVAVPLFDGELGIAPSRAPMIGRLGYGELRLVEGNRTMRYYIDGGFVQVVGNVVTILTSRAVPIEKLDAQVAAEHLATARARKTNSDETLAVRNRLVAQARAQLRLARTTPRNSA